jgi:transposase InsO family protein
MVALMVVRRVLGVLGCGPTPDANEVEIAVLRHQLAVLRRQVARPRYGPADRMLLATLAKLLPRERWPVFLVTPSTLLRWHREMVARRWIYPHTGRGSRGLDQQVVDLVLRLARENSSWGYRRVHGELLVLGVKVAASTVWEILREAGIDPAPDRTATTWAGFLRSQANALLAADFIETVTLTGARMYILAVIEHASRRIRILGATAHPTTAWVTQAARTLVMDLEDAGSAARYLIRDRDGKYPALFDAILADAGITVVRSGVQIPRMNAIMERWVRTCRRELLDRTLIWNQRHLLHALHDLHEYEAFYNAHRPHQGIANARPLQPLPEPITDPDQLARLDIRRRDRLGGILRVYEHAA